MSSEQDGEKDRPVVVRKRLVEHQAMMNTGGSKNLLAVAEWLGAWFIDSGPDGEIYVETLHGTVRCDVGDWIVKGDRDAWPVDADQFGDTYEVVDADAGTARLA